MGYVQVIFGGNAMVAHDCEAAMFGTSLGVDLQTGDPVQDGHRNHLRAINTIRRLAVARRRKRAWCANRDHRRGARSSVGRTRAAGIATTGRSRMCRPRCRRRNACAPRCRGWRSRCCWPRCCTGSPLATCCPPRCTRRGGYQSLRRHQAGRSRHNAGDRPDITDVELFLQALDSALE